MKAIRHIMLAAALLAGVVVGTTTAEPQPAEAATHCKIVSAQINTSTVCGRVSSYYSGGLWRNTMWIQIKDGAQVWGLNGYTAAASGGYGWRVGGSGTGVHIANWSSTARPVKAYMRASNVNWIWYWRFVWV